MIRLPRPADLELVRDISYEAYAPYETLLGGLPLPATEDYAPRIAAGQVWLLGDAGVLVLERHADHALLYSVAVRPAARGTGLGRTLLDHAERLSAGLPELRLYTNALMTRNQAIYAKRGFTETGRRPHPLRPAFTVVDMTKQLATAEGELRRLLDVMARLRAPDGCPWDQVQSFDSIAPYTIEKPTRSPTPSPGATGRRCPTSWGTSSSRSSITPAWPRKPDGSTSRPSPA